MLQVFTADMFHMDKVPCLAAFNRSNSFSVITVGICSVKSCELNPDK